MKGVIALSFLALVSQALSGRLQDLYDELDYVAELEEAYDELEYLMDLEEAYEDLHAAYEYEPDYYYYGEGEEPGESNPPPPPPSAPEGPAPAPTPGTPAGPAPTGPSPFPTNCGVNKYNNKRSFDQQDLQSLFRSLRDTEDIEMVKRIMGGQEAQRGKYPWIAFVIIQHGGGNAAICGGSLVTPEWIVSAGHCFFGTGPQYQPYANQLNKIEIVLGEHNNNPNQQESSEQIFTPKKVIVHPNYDPHSTSENNDIALIKLPKAATFNDYVKPICMPDAPVPAGTECYAAGWGKNRKGNTPEKLHDVKLVSVTNRKCSTYHPGKKLTGGMMCAMHPPNKKMGDSCEGDSGGPLSCKVNGKWILTGATSFGVDCEKGDRAPGVYANVFFYRNWMANTINANK